MSYENTEKCEIGFGSACTDDREYDMSTFRFFFNISMLMGFQYGKTK